MTITLPQRGRGFDGKHTPRPVRRHCQEYPIHATGMLQTTIKGLLRCGILDMNASLRPIMFLVTVLLHVRCDCVGH